MSDVTIWSSENWFFAGFSVNSTPKCAQFDIPTLCNVFIVTSYSFGCRLKFCVKSDKTNPVSTSVRTHKQVRQTRIMQVFKQKQTHINIISFLLQESTHKTDNI